MDKEKMAIENISKEKLAKEEMAKVKLARIGRNKWPWKVWPTRRERMATVKMACNRCKNWPRKIWPTVEEKMAKEGAIEPYMGMWLASVVFLPLGIFLTYKATADSVLLIC